MRRRWLALLVLTVACNDVPVDGLEGVQVHVTTRSSALETTKVDVLWVVDRSTSMADEQVALAAHFDTFLDVLEAGVNDLDVRLGVVTMDGQGELWHTPAGTFGVVATRKQVVPCAGEGDSAACAALGEGWELDGAELSWKGPWCQCVRTCVDDAECQATFGQDGPHTCLDVQGQPPGCMPVPQSQGCPDAESLGAALTERNGGPWLVGSDAREFFACTGLVGIDSDKSVMIEHGLGAALDALDPQGPNADQARAFRRDDAWLVVIFLTDEDDCTARPGSSFAYEEESTCACDDDRLLPVATVANRLKAFAGDPSRVLVAALTGDAEDSAAAAEYMDWKCQEKTFYDWRLVCASGAGSADYGGRYLRLTEHFGPNGIASNLCNPDGFGPSLDTIANRIVGVVSNVCLPRPVADQETVTVTLHRQGQAPQPVGWTLVAAPGCADDGQGTAVKLDTPIGAGEWVEVDYEASVGS